MNKKKKDYKDYYQKNKERISKYEKEYYQKNKEKIKDYYQKNREKKKDYYQKNKKGISKYRKEYYQKNKDRILAYVLENYRMRLYGMSIAEYNTMYTEQHGCCIICKEHFPSLCVDHNHAIGKVRGLLCYRCNIMIGLAHDNVDILYSAIDYLNK